MSLTRLMLRSVFPFIVLAGIGAGTVGACTLVVGTSSYKEGCEVQGKKACEVTQGQFSCVEKTDRDYGCAGPTCVACTIPHAAATCGNDGNCAVGSCIGTFLDCNGRKDDGCEIDKDSTVGSCGGCLNATIGIKGVDCNAMYPPATLAAGHVTSLKCASGQCRVSTCERGFRDCNSSGLGIADGCETPDGNDNCGSCGLKCIAPKICDTTGSSPICK